MAGNSLAVYTAEKQREVVELMGFRGTNAQITLLFQLAEHYQLDPLTKEITLIPNKGPFIGVWGRIHVAHRSGMLDGLEMDDEWEDDNHYKVRCIVWRKDQSHPAAKVIGRVAKTEKKDWPLEIARARAVRAALGYAFSIHDTYDHADDNDDWTPAPDERMTATVIPSSATNQREGVTERQPPEAGARGDEEHGEVTPSAAPPGPPADPFDALPQAEPIPKEARTIVVGGHSLAERLAIAAKKAGIDDDDTRHDVIYAASAGHAQRGQEVVAGDTADRCFEAFAGLADGTVELRYKPDGTPTLIRPRRRQADPKDDF